MNSKRGKTVYLLQIQAWSAFLCVLCASVVSMQLVFPICVFVSLFSSSVPQIPATIRPSRLRSHPPVFRVPFNGGSIRNTGFRIDQPVEIALASPGQTSVTSGRLLNSGIVGNHCQLGWMSFRSDHFLNPVVSCLLMRKTDMQVSIRFIRAGTRNVMGIENDPDIPGGWAVNSREPIEACEVEDRSQLTPEEGLAAQPIA